MGVRDLLIVGAGGFARETAAAMEAFRPPPGASGWRLRGFLDDDPALWGRVVDGVPVLGGGRLVHDHPDASVVVCVGSPVNRWSRARAAARLGLPPGRWATLVHRTAVVPRTCRIGAGSVLHAQTVLTTGVRLGGHAHVMPHVVLTHDDVVGDFATLAAGVRVAGGVRIGTGAYLGAGSLVREHRSVGAWSLVGMGAVVTGDVPDAEVWAGVPARRLRAVPVPDDVARDEATRNDVPEDGVVPETPMRDGAKQDGQRGDGQWGDGT